MKPLKLILAAVLGLAVVVSGYSVEQKKERKENYISQMIPIKNRYELNVVLEKIPEDLLPAKDSTEKK